MDFIIPILNAVNALDRDVLFFIVSMSALALVAFSLSLLRQKGP